jgi:hypothetical protein
MDLLPGEHLEDGRKPLGFDLAVLRFADPREEGRVGAPFPPLAASLIASGVNGTPQSFTPSSRSDHSPPEIRQFSGEKWGVG